MSCASHPDYDLLLLPPFDDEVSGSIGFAAKTIATGAYTFKRMEHAYSSRATRPVNLGVCRLLAGKKPS